jgi:hypothetical protein
MAYLTYFLTNLIVSSDEPQLQQYIQYYAMIYDIMQLCEKPCVALPCENC